MDKQKQAELIETELYKIANYLEGKLKKDERGIYWETIHFSSDSRGFYYALNETIFNGSAGIILFFLSVYEHSGNGYYLNIAKEATNRLLDDDILKKPEDYTFYTGGTGVIYLCLKVYESTGDDHFIYKAKELAQNYNQEIVQVEKDDILSGTAGNLFVLTYLYHYSPENALLNKINFLISSLLDNVKIAKAGVKWGKGALSIDSLTGFSHGGSGIAHVLIQVGIYFNNQQLIWLAEQALEYEMLYYDEEKENWLDLRVLEEWLNDPEIFEWNIDKFKDRIHDFNAWAHGAAGTALTRLYAYAITGKEAYKEQVYPAINRSLRDFSEKRWISYALCNGYGGIADFLIKASILLQRNEWYETGVEIALAAIEEYKGKDQYHTAWGTNGQEDFGLFTGTAGIGYMLLNTLTEGKNDSILHPDLPARNQQESNNIHIIGIKEFIYTKYFKITLTLIRDAEVFDKKIFEAPDIDIFIQHLNGLIYKVELNKQKLLDAFAFEKKVVKCWKKHQGSLCFHTRIAILKKQLDTYLDMEDEEFCSQIFIASPFVHVVHTHWNWKQWLTQQLITCEEAEGYRNLLYSSDTEIHHMLISKLPAFIIQKAGNGITIHQLVAEIEKTNTTIAANELTAAVIGQVKELLKNFCLMSSQNKLSEKSDPLVKSV